MTGSEARRPCAECAAEREETGLDDIWCSSPECHVLVESAGAVPIDAQVKLAALAICAEFELPASDWRKYVRQARAALSASSGVPDGGDEERRLRFELQRITDVAAKVMDGWWEFADPETGKGAEYVTEWFDSLQSVVDSARAVLNVANFTAPGVGSSGGVGQAVRKRTDAIVEWLRGEAWRDLPSFRGEFTAAAGEIAREFGTSNGE
jgi:hypothetical protein